MYICCSNRELKQAERGNATMTAVNTMKYCNIVEEMNNEIPGRGCRPHFVLPRKITAVGIQPRPLIC